MAIGKDIPASADIDLRVFCQIEVECDGELVPKIAIFPDFFTITNTSTCLLCSYFADAAGWFWVKLHSTMKR